MDLIQTNITPADGEQSVRTYCCTYYKSKLLGLETNGYLGVTNKRVIFQALGSSVSGKSVLQSEVPVADVSGISSYKGIYFSLMSLLGAFFATAIFIGLTAGLMTTIAMAMDSYDAFRAIAWIVAIAAVIGSFLLPVKSIWRPILAGVSAGAFFAIGGNLFSFMGFGGSPDFTIFLAAIALIYALLCMYWNARRPTFSLSINSKGGSSTPISISSASGLGLFTVSAGKSLNAEPAKDAEPMLKELGALILDIQMLGDYGISKWTQH
jgi:phosphoglycerol transferase MdoB-like AlkP superfamily enzyme